MQTSLLVPHSAHPPSSALEMHFASSVKGGWLTMRWRIEGSSNLAIPPFAGRRRADELWRTTCFELFVQGEGAGYCEFNFSPSEAWAAYDFDRPREGMRNRQVAAAPVCTWRGGGPRLALFDAALRIDALPALPCRIGPTAIIEETGGRKSYWAAVHGRPQPDFHDPACFTVTLAAPDVP